MFMLGHPSPSFPIVPVSLPISEWMALSYHVITNIVSHLIHFDKYYDDWDSNREPPDPISAEITTYLGGPVVNSLAWKT